MDERFLNWKYNKIVQGVQLLAADYDTQIEVLPDFVHVPDEVVLEFGESFHLAESLLADGLIDQIQYNELYELDQAIDKTFDELPKDSDYPEMLEQLQYHTAWEELRVKARETLTVMNVEQQKPDLDYNIYVSGPSHETEQDLHTVYQGSLVISQHPFKRIWNWVLSFWKKSRN